MRNVKIEWLGLRISKSVSSFHCQPDEGDPCSACHQRYLHLCDGLRLCGTEKDRNFSLTSRLLHSQITKAQDLKIGTLMIPSDKEFMGLSANVRDMIVTKASKIEVYEFYDSIHSPELYSMLPRASNLSEVRIKNYRFNRFSTLGPDRGTSVQFARLFFELLHERIKHIAREHGSDILMTRFFFHFPRCETRVAVFTHNIHDRLCPTITLDYMQTHAEITRLLRLGDKYDAKDETTWEL